MLFVQFDQDCTRCVLLPDTKPPSDLESVFFDLEVEMENNMCRDMICLDDESEKRESSQLLT